MIQESPILAQRIQLGSIGDRSIIGANSVVSHSHSPGTDNRSIAQPKAVADEDYLPTSNRRLGKSSGEHQNPICSATLCVLSSSMSAGGSTRMKYFSQVR